MMYNLGMSSAYPSPRNRVLLDWLGRLPVRTQASGKFLSLREKRPFIACSYGLRQFEARFRGCRANRSIADVWETHIHNLVWRNACRVCVIGLRVFEHRQRRVPNGLQALLQRSRYRRPGIAPMHGQSRKQSVARLRGRAREFCPSYQGAGDPTLGS